MATFTQPYTYGQAQYGTSATEAYHRALQLAQMQQYSGQTMYRTREDQITHEKVEEIRKYETKKEKETKMFQPLKDYINKNREILFTVGFILLLDHFIFKGAMKNKIQELLEGVISKVKNAGGKNEQG